MNKKILLLLGIAIFFLWTAGSVSEKNLPREIGRNGSILSMGFEDPWNISYDPDGDYPSPAPGWDVDGLCTSDQHYWSQLAGYQHSGNYCAGVLPSNGSGGDLFQNEWMKTPWLNLSGYGKVFLKFWGIWNWLTAPADNDEYNLLISDNDIYWYPLIDILTIQEGSGGPAGYGWCWNEYQVVVDISENITNLGLNANHIKIAWQAYGGLNDTLYSMVTLDDVEIFEGKVHNINTNEWFPNITAAINDEQTQNEHILEVYPGIYQENVVVWKELTIRSKYGNPFNTTIIPANINIPIVEINVDNVTLSGFEIRGGNITLPPAGVNILNSSNCEIDNCYIHLTEKGIILNSSLFIPSKEHNISNCIISDNEIGIEISGCFYQASGWNTISNCSILNNSYGILSTFSTEDLFLNCNIYNNDCGIELGSLTNNCTISNCEIYSNEGDGIWLYASFYNMILDCDISLNGNGLSLYYSTYNLIFHCNISYNENGTAFYIGSRNNRIQDSFILSNQNKGVIGYADNNTVTNCNISYNDIGIWLYIGEDYTISNCSFYYNYMSIYLENSTDNTIDKNIIVSSGLRGVSLQFSFNNKISNSTILNSNGHGILIIYSDNNLIRRCIVENNSGCGIAIWFSSNNQILNCTIYENSLYGVYLDSSPNNVIKHNNTFINDGLFIAGNLNAFVQNIDATNKVNGKPLYYFLNLSNIIIDGIEIGELIMANCSGFLIQNINISNTDVAMEIAFSSQNQINNCSIFNNYDTGIYFINCSNNNITNSVVHDNLWYGVWLLFSHFNRLINCSFYENFERGVILYESNSNYIINCTIYNNSVGILLSDCIVNEIMNCDIYNNSKGIYFFMHGHYNVVMNCNIWNNSQGISIFDSHYNTIENCYISREIGINITSGIGNIIRNCTVVGISKGIYLFYSFDNVIEGGIISGAVAVYIEDSLNNHIINCNIYTGGIYTYGILFQNSSNNIIDKCNIYHPWIGVYMKNSHNNIINSSNIIGMWEITYWAIWLNYSLNNIINNCNISEYKWFGIYSQYSPYTEIKNCNIFDTIIGRSIDLIYSDNYIIQNCNIYDSGWGIYSFSCINGSINNCNISNTFIGICFSSSSGCEVYGCYLNDEPFGVYILNSSYIDLFGCYLYENAYGIEISSSHNISIYNSEIVLSTYSGIFIFNSTNNTILNCFIQFYQTGIELESSFNNKIIGCEIDGGIGKESAVGIILANFSSNNYITSCNIHDNVYGIKLKWHSENNIINNCNLDWNIWEGINITFSPNNEINNTNIKHSDVGLIINGFNATSWPFNHIISNCSIYYNNYGIEFYYTHNNLINSCSIFSNTYNGIELHSSNSNVISNSEIYNNGNNGIYVVFSSNNTIHTNHIYWNGWYGIDEPAPAPAILFNFSDNNLIYNNAFYNNAQNAKDNGYNTWNITNQPGVNIVGGPYLGGNYWDDYEGVDTDNDGKGDTNLPYNCSGNIENGGDWHPLIPFPPNGTYFGFLLYEGWNLITLPCQNSYNASSLYNAIDGCSIILSWNASIQDFELYVPGSPYDFEIEDGHGYFIGMNYDSIFSLAGLPIQSVNVTLYVGWNILGWFNENETTADSLYNAIDNCTIVLKWNASLQNFELYVPGSPYNFVISQGEGFLVAVSEQSIWHGEG